MYAGPYTIHWLTLTALLTQPKPQEGLESTIDPMG